MNSVEIDKCQYLIQVELPASLWQSTVDGEKTACFFYVHVQYENDQLHISQLDGLKFSSHLKSEKVEHQIFEDALFGHRIHGDTKRIAAELKKSICKFTIDEEIHCRPGKLEQVTLHLETSSAIDSDGYESYAEYAWYDDAVAIVEFKLNRDGDHCWTPNKVKTGQASVVFLKWGGQHPEDTGGGYTIVQIQLPKTVAESQEFELRPPKGTRMVMPEKSWLNRDLSELTTTEIAVFTFGNPIGESMASTHTGFKGRLKILEIEKQRITIELTLKNLAAFGIGGNKRVYKLTRTPAENAG